MSSESSSPISTPMVLTPDSTGSVPSASDPTTAPAKSDGAAKKARRQTAFYPNVNSSNKQQKPFSRSAAKRESVMALGSIEHLQHYFTKTGIAAKKNAIGKQTTSILVPALGGLSHIRNNSSLSDFQLPPSPMLPAPPSHAYPPMVKTYEVNPETLLPGVIDDLNIVASAWSLDGGSGSQNHSPGLLGENVTSTGRVFDVLDVMKTTTRTIRSIRNYLVALPDESTGTLRAQFRSKLLAASLPVPKKLMSQQAKDDPLSIIRKSALELLTVLRALEDKSRLPLSDDAYDAQSDGGRHSRVASPVSQSSDLPSHAQEEDLPGIHEVDPETSVAFSLINVQGRRQSVLVWEDEDTSFSSGEEEQAKRELWDERLVLGSGWLYKQDIKLEDLGKEQEVVKGYLDVVDEVLFGGTKHGQRGWERQRLQSRTANGRESRKHRVVSAGDLEGRFTASLAERSKRRVVSMGMVDVMNGVAEEHQGMQPVAEEEPMEEPPTPSTAGLSSDDEDLPPWARYTLFTDDEIGRIHAVLSVFLPQHYLEHLPPSSPRIEFLSALCSGQLLCYAYNACVRKSGQPWGYISLDAVHDILALEKADRESGNAGKPSTSWTFRRIDNLRLWAGALKLRYMLPIVSSGALTPGSNNTPVPSPSPTKLRFTHTMETPVSFDAKIVAKKEDGWDQMLENALKAWVVKVVDERRDVR